MKKLSIAIVLSIIIAQLYSCGPSAAEVQQMQKHRDDSVKNAVERKFTAESQLKDANVQLSNMQKALEIAKANLEAETDRMGKIKEWQIGRSTDEREQQIKNQSLNIQNIQDNISAIQQKINQTEDRIVALKNELQKFQ